MNQDIMDATNEKRFHHPLFGNELLVETGFPEVRKSYIPKNRTDNHRGDQVFGHTFIFCFQ